MVLNEERYTIIRHRDCTYLLSYRDQIISLIIQSIVSSLEAAVDEVPAATLLGCIILITVCFYF